MNSPNSRFHFEQAQPGDHQQILQILEESDFDGKISLLYTRRPDPYASLLKEGEEVEVIVCRDQYADGQVVGFGACAFNELYVNGQIQKVGYLFALRLRREYQKQFRLLHQGYAYLEQLLQTHGVEYYLTTILEENLYAQQLLEKRRQRSPVPWYEPLGGYEVYSLRASWRDFHSDWRRALQPQDHLALRRAKKNDLKRILEFYQQVGPAQHFFPALKKEDLLKGNQRLPGLSYEDFYLLYDLRTDEIMACGACWNQQEYKQYVVKGYGGIWRFIRPFSGFFPLLGYPSLPAVGSTLNFCTVSLWAVREQSEEVFRVFVGLLARELRDYSYFLIGINANHPLRRVLQQRPHLVYRSKMYLVNWEKIAVKKDQLATVYPLYLECGRL